MEAVLTNRVDYVVLVVELSLNLEKVRALYI